MKSSKLAQAWGPTVAPMMKEAISTMVENTELQAFVLAWMRIVAREAGRMAHYTFDSGTEFGTDGVDFVFLEAETEKALHLVLDRNGFWASFESPEENSQNPKFHKTLDQVFGVTAKVVASWCANIMD